MSFWDTVWHIPTVTTSAIYWSGNSPVSQLNYDPNSWLSGTNTDRIICGKGFFEFNVNISCYTLTSYLIARVDLLRNSASLSSAYSNNIVKYNVSANTLKDNIICNWLYDNSAGATSDYFQVNIYNGGTQNLSISEAFISINRLS